MKSKLAKPVFFIFLLLTFLAGWYFYIMNPNAMYTEHMENINNEDARVEDARVEDARVEDARVEDARVEDARVEDNTKNPEDNRKKRNEDTNKNNNIVNIQDASREHGNYNSNMYAGFDPTSQYVGVYTNIDQIHQSTSFSELSDNPMDPNWGGVLYTKDAVDSGKYKDDEVVPYANDPERGIGGISTSIHNGSMKSVFA